jgi:hypothetical protein
MTVERDAGVKVPAALLDGPSTTVVAVAITMLALPAALNATGAALGVVNDVGDELKTNGTVADCSSLGSQSENARDVPNETKNTSSKKSTTSKSAWNAVVKTEVRRVRQR